MNKIPIILLIDVEPDAHFVDRSTPLPWAGYEKAVEFLEGLRPRILEATGSPARFSWGYRMDPQIELTYGRLDWPVHHYSGQFRHLQERGDAFGLHLHGYRWDEAAQGWISDFGNARYMRQCTENALKAFKGSTGKACDFFRHGERWMSDEAMDLLDDLGVPCDLSLEPGHGALSSFHPNKPHTGAIPAQIVPARPYRPRRGDFRKEDTGKQTGIWEIPLTTAVLAPRFKFWRKPQVETANLYLPPQTLARIIRSGLEDHGYLAMVARADVFSNPAYFRNLDATLMDLLRHPAATQFVFSSPMDAVGMRSTPA